MYRNENGVISPAEKFLLLRLKKQQLRSRDGNGKCHKNIPILNTELLFLLISTYAIL
jgi:hypothetical protein